MAHEELNGGGIFPLGGKAESEYFTGETYRNMIFTDPEPLNAAIGSVTFAPGSRTNWHTHKVGQVLLVTGGEGWYREEGKPAQPLKQGDVVNIPANVKHWHGAAQNSWFVHIALTPGETQWLEPVEDEAYGRLGQGE
ncbi:cupin domain-containing protein [Saccharibacillus sp. CPCC 101409]|uniref:cupin domain-containing protein n=1 Tax=Saccharibacillus sp. CPCC 101409 TaxID=3058041 RepID=UPI002673AC4A|nr:cupin domain-containing protein [Saccharibacillus sp. CPCC 101409]MDO3408421.1 cupin domain-containing protein [Saccharibacillus sp. CPCC 101409]